MGVLLPEEEDLLSLVARTCGDAVARQHDVQLDAGAITALAARLAADPEVLARPKYSQIPIRFDSLEQEINYLFVLHLLDFGSGYDRLLLERVRRDAHEVVQYGTLGMLMHGARLDARFLQRFTTYQVFSFFGVDAAEDAELMPGVTLSRQGPLAPFVKGLRDVINQTGAHLLELGHAEPAAFVLGCVEGGARAGQPPSAAALASRLAHAFPAFSDRLPEGAPDLADVARPPASLPAEGSEAGAAAATAAGGPEVVFARKAQGLAAALALRFAGEDARFAFADLDRLTFDSGSALPAVLRDEGVLRYSEPLAAAVAAGADLAGTAQEVALRAAAVEAGRRLSKASGGAFPPLHASLRLLERAGRAGRAGGAGGVGARAKHVALGAVSY